MKRLTKAQIIDESDAFYSEDPQGRRAVSDNGRCYYLMPNGCQCVVGRCMTPKGVRRAAIDAGTVYGLEDSFGLDSLLLARYKGHDVAFWAQLQHWHDQRTNWNGELSDAGQRALASIRAYHA